MPGPYTHDLPDNDGVPVRFEDIRTLKAHIDKNHATGTSVYSQRGHHFTVDEAFRERVRKLAEA